MNSWRRQSVRFVVVGIVSNLVLYLAYLFLTTVGVGHKLAMTLLFLAGTLQTFFFNKTWTFSHQGLYSSTFVKYLSAYGFAYLLNLAALIILVDRMTLPHQAVQGVMIVMVALLLFILQKLWVFRTPTRA